MAEKIMKFFKKKKMEAQFLMSGPGQKLGDSSSTTSKSSSSTQQSRSSLPDKRTGLSAESKVAAEAALARLQQQKPINPNFNTSAAAIRLKAKKELESQASSELASTAEPEVTSYVSAELEAEKNLPENYAVSGLYFKCPMVSNAVLTREEWQTHIKDFLYEQLESERGLTACLIIQSCNHNKEKIDTCVSTLCKYLENIVNNPTEEKYYKIRLSNKVFQERVKPIEGALDLLQAAGFIQKKITNDDGTSEDYLVFDIDNVPFETLSTLIDGLRTAEAIPLELDRNVQVLLPSQNNKGLDLPSSFYTLSLVELQRELKQRAEEAEKNQMLRTKAMREADERRFKRKYKYAIIRIRFPDGILLQGTFDVNEKYAEVHEFVQENIVFGELPFTLVTATGHKLNLEEDFDKTISELQLVPTAILNFTWHASIAEDVDTKQYIKPDVLLLAKDDVK